MVTPLSNANLSGGRPDSSAGIQTGGPEDWFGPGNPMRPTAPPEVAGRTLDFPVAYNLAQRPRAYEAITFETLRALANSYDVLRTVIESRKDQIAGLEWKIVPRSPDDKPDKNPALKARVDALTEFFREPYPGIEWAEWIRMLLEDLFVIDAPTIYPRPNRGGGIYGFKPIDGATIKRVIDDWGDTPDPPAPAYQQVLKGLPAVNYTADQLIYRPRNRRTNKIYGFSPVEQIIAIINIALRRETWQLEFFTHGTLPDALIGTPPEWTPDQIRNFQDWFDARLLGNTGGRRGATFVPGDMSKGVYQTKETELFGAAEEWIARVVCYAFSVSPQAFVKMMNRATGETAKDTATEEGLAPIKQWVKGTVDSILRKYLKSADMQLVWVEEEALDQKIQSEIVVNEAKAGLLTIDEGRKILGREPTGIEETSRPMVFTATGWVPIAVEDAMAEAKDKAALIAPPGGAPGGPNGGEGGGGDGGDRPPPPKPVSKALTIAGNLDAYKMAETLAPISPDRPAGRRAATSARKSIEAMFADAADDVATQVEAALKAAAKMTKADEPIDGVGDNDAAVTQITTVPQVDVNALVKGLDLSSFNVIVDAVEESLFDIASDTALRALAQIGVKAESALVNQVNTEAVAFARARAAELVGKRFLADGSLVDNPNAKWAITDTTRLMLRETIAKGLEDNIGTPAIADAIQEAYAFSKDRAKVIANTEVANANEQSKLIGWRHGETAGVALKKKWLTANDDRVSPDCRENGEQDAIPLDEDFKSGDDAPLAHPGCRCVLVPEVDLDLI